VQTRVVDGPVDGFLDWDEVWGRSNKVLSRQIAEADEEDDMRDEVLLLKDSSQVVSGRELHDGSGYPRDRLAAEENFLKVLAVVRLMAERAERPGVEESKGSPCDTVSLKGISRSVTLWAAVRRYAHTAAAPTHRAVDRVRRRGGREGGQE
jgi:hypothetical protein